MKENKTFNQPQLLTPQNFFIVGALVIALILSIMTINEEGFQQGVLLWLGLLLGFTLFHARFGFTSAFRQFMSVGNGRAIRAHMIMLAVACTLFAPILATGFGLFGTTPGGNVHAVGTSVIVGAFLFGIGMQLGGGCASGTLYHVGGGRSASFVVLFGFILGSVLGAWHWGFWVQGMPSFPEISLATSTGLGYGGAWAVSILAFAAIFAITWAIQKKHHSPAMKPLPTAKGWMRVLRGSWPLWVAAVALAILNAAVLITRGTPWGITSGFALWGSQAAQSLGVDVSQWTYWVGERGADLHHSVLANSTSVMDFGIIIGAFLASAAGGLFALTKVPARLLVGSLIGGLLMGYGARIAFGCNIGAYFSGIASFSLHGWVWMIMALAGTFVALYLRPLFGMSVPNKKDSFC